MKLASTVALMTALMVSPAVRAQGIAVNPTGVNVNAESATVVFLTFGRVGNYRAIEALWCGELIPATPDLGLKCNPSTIFGSLPVRYDRLAPSGDGAVTDIMTIPPSVARRAVQAAEAGAESRFFYVRHFVSVSGGPDQYVAVTCRLTNGGARVPLALTDVRLKFASDAPVQFVSSGATLPRLHAEVAYNGTGRLKGRWEVVLPGEAQPESRDLLTEATLPIEERNTQRRYAVVESFNVFLPPVGTYVLDGPDPSHLPTALSGEHLVLLRIEASDDREGDSNLHAVDAGGGIVHSGAVAAFPIPPLRYVVGTPSAGTQTSAEGLRLLTPDPDAMIATDQPLEFTWAEMAPAAFYRLDVQSGQNTVLSAIVRPGVGSYRAPPWLRQKMPTRWRVVAFNGSSAEIAETDWRPVGVAAQ
jgi:hypothetical protein